MLYWFRRVVVLLRGTGMLGFVPKHKGQNHKNIMPSLAVINIADRVDHGLNGLTALLGSRDF